MGMGTECKSFNNQQMDKVFCLLYFNEIPPAVFEENLVYKNTDGEGIWLFHSSFGETLDFLLGKSMTVSAKNEENYSPHT